MPEWTAFAGFVGVVLLGLLLLARASAGAVTDVSPPSGESSSHRFASHDAPATLTDRVVGIDPGAAASRRSVGPSTPLLLVNVVVSQGLFGAILLAGVWLADVPPGALGLSAGAITPVALGAGLGLGLALHAVNAVGSRLVDQFDLGDSAALRRALTPESPAGWAVLLVVVLPVVAGFEELLFRGVLIGALATGFGVSPWLLAVGSSIAFALGHGAQGRIGIVVTGALGFVLAAAFVLTGSLATVVLAHYLVNALEFVVNARRD
jgi:membrane protease YdiL (CAAX protease family)